MFPKPRPIIAGLVLAMMLDGQASGEIEIFFGGDTSHGESYQAKYLTSEGVDVLAQRGYDDSFRGVRHLMDGADLRVLNLETPLTLSRVSPVRDKISYLWSHPVKAPASLKRHGVNAVTIANNHALDFGPDGMRDTLAALDQAGIACFGAGETVADAEAAYVARIADGDEVVPIAFIGMFERRESYKPFDFYATETGPGANAIDLERLKRQIAELKRQNPAPFVIVTPHWGENYVWRIQRLRELAAGMIEAGADLVIGHGAHRLQEIERIGGKLVFFSIGNFVFNSEGNFKRRKSNSYSLPLRLRLARNADGYDLGVRCYPIVGDNLVTDYRPRPVNAEEMAEVKRLLLAHDPSGTVAGEAAWGEDELGPCLAFGTAKQGLRAGQ